MLVTLAQSTQTLWMPEAQSTYAADVDWLFYFLLWMSVFFTVLVAGLVVYFAITRHDGGTPRNAAEGPTHGTMLELTWTGIPVILVLIIFFYGYQSYLKIATLPPDAHEVWVNSARWNWSFRHPNGKDSPDLHVPANTPILLTLNSQDVIHSIYVPAFRMKRDAVPGRYNKVWFEAKWDPDSRHMQVIDGRQVMVYDLFCAEYCGQSHAAMTAKVYVYQQHDFQTWVTTDDTAGMTPAEVGERLMRQRGCLQCHSLEEQRGPQGPGFRNVYGSERPLTDGTTVTADEAYIRESIVQPQAKIVQGFAGINMTSYEGQFSETEMIGIVEYFKSLSDRHDEPLLEAFPGDEEETPAEGEQETAPPTGEGS